MSTCICSMRLGWLLGALDARANRRDYTFSATDTRALPAASDDFVNGLVPASDLQAVRKALFQESVLATEELLGEAHATLETIRAEIDARLQVLHAHGKRYSVSRMVPEDPDLTTGTMVHLSPEERPMPYLYPYPPPEDCSHSLVVADLDKVDAAANPLEEPCWVSIGRTEYPTLENTANLIATLSFRYV